MQRAEDSSSRIAPGPERSGLRPAVAFFLVIVVGAVIGAVIFLTKPTPAAEPTGTTTTATEPNFALTDEEAIARFEELQSLLQNAYANHDASLLPALYTDTSPLQRLAQRELARLSQDKVFDLSEFDTQRVQISSKNATEIRLREVVLVTPRFETEGGRDVTKDATTVRQVVEWTVRLERSSWLLHDALITKAKPLQ